MLWRALKSQVVPLIFQETKISDCYFQVSQVFFIHLLSQIFTSGIKNMNINTLFLGLEDSMTKQCQFMEPEHLLCIARVRCVRDFSNSRLLVENRCHKKAEIIL